MTTTFRENESVAAALEQSTPEARLGRLVTICALTAMLLSFVAIYNLNADVNDLAKNKIQYIQARLADLSFKLHK